MPGFVAVVYAGGAPVVASSGAQRVACEHLAEWLVVRDALEVARGRGHIRYFQTQGGAKDSGGTHECGSASDREHVGMESVMDSREMGMIEYPRLHRLGWPADKGEHDHGVLPCGDNSCNGYQITAYWNGYNGLGLNGVAAADPLPKPSKRRTWQEGIVWAHAEIARLTGTTTTQEDDDMDVYAYTDAGGQGFRLRTAMGETGLNTMGEVDACLSALNATSTRVFEGGKWVIKTANPCLASEAAILAAKVALIRGAATPTPGAGPDLDMLAAKVADTLATRLAS